LDYVAVKLKARGVSDADIATKLDELRKIDCSKWKDATPHLGSHPKYSAAFESDLRVIMNAYEDAVENAAGNAGKLAKAKADALKATSDLSESYRKKLLSGSIDLN
jgi:hypothetical protein